MIYFFIQNSLAGGQSSYQTRFSDVISDVTWNVHSNIVSNAVSNGAGSSGSGWKFWWLQSTSKPLSTQTRWPLLIIWNSKGDLANLTRMRIVAGGGDSKNGPGMLGEDFERIPRRVPSGRSLKKVTDCKWIPIAFRVNRKWSGAPYGFIINKFVLLSSFIELLHGFALWTCFIELVWFEF